METWETKNAELRRRLGISSTNSSTPPSKDSIGHKGSGLTPTATPDRTQTLPPPGACSGCAGDLSDAADAETSWAQVWDILAVTLEKVHYLLPRRRCGCRRTTTAAPPFGAAGSVVYGPRINAAAILLAARAMFPSSGP
ncbi:MAG: IS66 family transposase, partial [Actinomycetota bacterium]|nr:IS66 family transposase [Actinomycetota bacterium]